MMKLKLLTVLTVALFSVNFALAQSAIKKSYAQLNSGDYAGFRATMKKHTAKNPADVAVYYAYARFYFDDENPAYNIDSAKYFSAKALSSFPTQMKKKQQETYAALGIRPPQAKNLNKQINTVAYNKALKQNTIDAWNHFITNYDDAAEKDNALAARNNLAFLQAKDKYDLSSFEQFMKQYPEAKEAGEARSLYEGLLYRSKTTDSTWQAFQSFIQQYPNSPHYKEAKANYERLLYVDKTKDGQLASFVAFVKNNPSNFYAPRAEDSIYALATRVSTKENYENFIKQFPSNPHIIKAWENYFQLSLVPYKGETIRAFRSAHEDFPYPGLIDKEEMSLLQNLTVTEANDLLGYNDSADSKTVIPVQFTDAGDFTEGLAVVSKQVNGKEQYGFINKYGDVKIPFEFSYAENFVNGFAIVGNGDCDEDTCKYGIINRLGFLVLPIEYDEVFPLENERVLLRKDSLYGYADANFKTVIPFKYEDAYSFSEGVAAVGTDSGWAFIDMNGSRITDAYFEKALSFSEGLAAVQNENELWGYINLQGKWVIKPTFLQAEQFIKGKAKVYVPAPATKKNKNSVKLPKERYIDKSGKFLDKP